MSSKVERAQLASFLKESRSWEVDKVAQLAKSRSAAWMVAGVAVAVAIANSVSTAALVTRQPDPPVVIRVNDTTGTVDVVSRLKAGDTTYDEVQRKYWTEQYVRLREGFSKELAEDSYYAVGLMSGNAEQKRYADGFNPKNATSPLIVYGDTGKVRIRVKGSSFIKSNVLLVRYSREVEKPGQERPEVTHLAATVVFKYSGSPMSERDRRINPLGYQVMEYRIDPDAATVDLRSVLAAPAPQPVAPPTSVTVLPATGPTTVVPAIAPTSVQR